MKRFDDLLTFIGANKKIEIIKLLIINVVIIALTALITVLLKQVMMVLVGLMGLLIGNYLVFSSYTSKKREILKNRESEFITIIGYMQLFLSNSYNVYQSFKALIPYSSAWMEEQLQSLINEIDSDKSVKPYINFAEKFTNKVTTNVMLTIYQMVDEGESETDMMQFDSLFQQISKTHLTNLIDDKERNMGSISSLPLIGAGIVTVLITFGISSVMGEMISVS